MARSNRNLYIAATVACLTAGLFGYSVGFIGGVIVLPSFLQHFHLDGLSPSELASARSSTVTLWLVGAFIGVPLGMPVCSRLGRRGCLLFAALLYVLGVILQLVSDGSLVFFEVGRFLNGLGVGAGTLVSPMYISEISPPSERGMLMSGYQTVLQFCALIGFWGAFVANATISNSSALQWQIPVAIQIVPGALLLIGTFFIPESPRFQAVNGKFQAAEESLSWLRRLPIGDPDLLQELTEIQEAAEASEKLQQRSFTAELRKKDVRKRLYVGVGLMVAQNMVGLNALNYYAPVIFMSAGFTSVSSSLFLTGMFGLVKLLSAIAFMFVFVRMRGNRFWLKLGTFVCGVAMLVLGYYVHVLPKPDGTHEAALTVGGVISVLMVYTFAFSFGVSLGPISWNVCSEIFPLHINAKCCMITTSTQWLWQIVIAGITPPLLARVGWVTYIIYAAFCFISFIWVQYTVPETKGVATGKPMDELFGVHRTEEEDEEAEDTIEEILETSPLLKNDRRRRSSLAAYM